MRIIISPAKQMRVDTDSFTCTELPAFMEKTEILKDWISGLTYMIMCRSTCGSCLAFMEL